jgi:hypothetical protein
MPFVGMSQDGNGIAVSSTIWIYATCSTALTTVTFLAYYWLVKLGREGTKASLKQLLQKSGEENGAEILEAESLAI